MHRKLAFILFSLIVTPLLQAATTPPGCVVIEGRESEKLPLDAIKSDIQTLVFEASGVPGLMIGIVAGEERAVISCGETAKGNGTRPANDSMWPIGSVSKVFTTQLLAALVNEGAVRLNTPVWQLLKTPKPDQEAVTLLNLATHSAGFPRQLPTLPANDDYQTNLPYDVSNFMAWYGTFTPPTAPGTHYQYSNVGFGLLGYLLGQAAGTDYAGALAKYVTKPMGLADTTLTLSDAQTAREVKSYWLNGDMIRSDWKFNFEKPSGGIYSSMHDLLKFATFAMGKTPEYAQDAALTRASYLYQADFDNPLAFGHDAMALAWTADFPARALPLTLTKSGWVDGVNCYVKLAPTARIALVSLTNKPYLNIDTDLQRILGILVAASHGEAAESNPLA